MNYTNMGASISTCGLYRYGLFRRWDDGEGVAVFIGLNPSTADAEKDDPTIRRCVAFAKAWGCSRLDMLNLFAFRATDPGVMKKADDPVGPLNDAYLEMAKSARFVVAAWGVHGTHLGRDKVVRAMLPNLSFLRLTKDGHPGHPLYLPASLTPQPWS